MNAVAEQPAVALDHLSWSGIQKYRQCPRSFRFRYVDKAPEERKASALVYGGAIHRAIERVHEARLAGKPTPRTEVLLKEYDAAWAEGAQGPEMTFAKDENASTLRDLAGRTLAAYRKHVLETRNRRTEVLAIEHSSRFQFLRDTEIPPIEARLDLVEKAGNEIIVTDFKTSRNGWNDGKVQENLGQVVLYAHALLPILREFNARRVVTKFIILTKGKNPKIQEWTPRPEQADVTRLKEAVADVWSGVKSGVFPRNEGWQCKTSCPFRVRCLGEGRGR